MHGSAQEFAGVYRYVQECTGVYMNAEVHGSVHECIGVHRDVQ